MDALLIYTHGFLLFFGLAIGHLHAQKTPSWRMTIVGALYALAWPAVAVFVCIKMLLDAVK